MKALDKRRHAKYSVRHFGGLVLAGLAICTLAVAVLATFRQVYATTGSVPTGGVPISSVGDGRNHIIMVHDDGIDTGFTTKALTLRQALEDAGIHIDAKDRTEPGLDEKLIAGSYQVNIYRARPVVIKDGATTLRLLTSYRTASQIAKDAGLVLHPEDKTALELSTDLIEDGAAEVMTVTRAIRFSLDFYGEHSIAYTQEKTVRAMLAARDIALGPDDGINLPLDTPMTDGIEVRLWRDGIQTHTAEESVPYTTRTVYDNDRPASYRGVQTPGVEGRRTVIYQVEMRGGQEISRQEINSLVTLKPVEQVIVIGVRGLLTTPSENQQITWDYLIGKGFSREQTAGIMGNLMQEHKFNTDGDGLAQWSGNRKARLYSMANPLSIYTQLDFMMMELNEGGVANLIRNTVTVEDAVKVFQNEFERCGFCREDLRVQYAYSFLARY